MHIYVLEYVCSFQILSDLFLFWYYVIVYCDVGCLYCFLVPFFCMWYFCLQVMFTTEKKNMCHMTTCGKKTRNMHTNCKIAPPRHLLTFDSGLSPFPCFELGPCILGLVYHRKNHESHDKETSPLLFAWKYPIDVEEYALCEAVPKRLHVVTLGSNHLQDTLFKTAETFKHLQTSSNLEPKSCEINGRFMTFPLRPDAAVRCCWEGLCLCGRAAPEIWRFGGGAEWERPRPQRQGPGESWEDLMVDVCWCSNV